MNGLRRHILVGAILAAAAGAVGCGPDGEPHYTILLAVISEPDTHVQIAKKFKAYTEEQTGWQDVYIVHEHGISRMYRGQYVTRSQAEGHLKRSHNVKASDGMSLFPGATIMNLPGKQIGRPEYDLSRTTRTWTVVVAHFFNVPKARYVGREKFAADYCQQLRDRGYQAYYQHGPAKSVVTIGDFAESAYKMAISPGGAATPYITDPALEKLLRAFPDLAVNGRKEFHHIYNPVSGKREKVATSTHIMKIPHKYGVAGDEVDPVGNW
ncbi:hypothetical protein LCGC14_0125090 [marine sediment metagenome]|uniref:Uncharacterized protein n=1 Tax=marine sediment metagenome TaxID=412755 RepID=A0A0F9V9P7_9ZZZZ|nr:hypothetical protein [Phycisphaerae bacterium]HDZ44969.1 hypothetical protein [Phycisphaerae bacterium]